MLAGHLRGTPFLLLVSVLASAIMITSAHHIAIYARYSSDVQNPASADDQIEVCRKYVAEKFANADLVQIFSDAALTGTTMDRPGLDALLDAVKAGHVRLIVAEGLDRLSRTLKDIAEIYEIVTYYGAELWTVFEGHITELHIGLKGTMNALVLKDMRARIRRGQAGRVSAGYVHSVAYGYDIVRGVVDSRGRNVNGIRKINEAEAVVIRRIFDEFIAGRKIRAICRGLNRDGIPARNGGIWRGPMITANSARSQGIIHKELYTGLVYYNRTRNAINPLDLTKKSIANPKSDWVVSYVPDLRIIDDDTWHAAQTEIGRRTEKAPEVTEPKTPMQHNQHALTGWIMCGWCGSPKSIANQGRYLCSGHRYEKSCKNSRGTKESVLMTAVFDALHKHIKTGPDFSPAFRQAFSAEDQRQHELRILESELQARISNLMDAVETGVKADAKHRILRLQAQLAHLRREMERRPDVVLPTETDIRAALAKKVQTIEMGRDIKQMRRMFKHLLKTVTLTPIAGQRCGEDIAIALADDWPGFWRMRL